MQADFCVLLCERVLKITFYFFDFFARRAPILTVGGSEEIGLFSSV